MRKEDHIQFALLGVTGCDRVEIYDIAGDDGLLESTKLSRDWQIFSFSTNFVKIDLLEDNRDIYIRHPSRYEIEYKKVGGDRMGPMVHCGSDNPNERCTAPREGIFRWEGLYLVREKYQGKFQ